MAINHLLKVKRNMSVDSLLANIHLVLRISFLNM